MQQIQAKTQLRTKKMVLTAMLACLAFVLNTYVYFPSMAPFQHFVDVIAAVLLGPWYACAAAFLCGIMRMMSGRTIQAVVGAVFGPILGGLIYQKTHNIWLVLVGEVAGTGLLGAMTAYPLMKLFYGLDAQSPLYYIPLYTPASHQGGGGGRSAHLQAVRPAEPDAGRAGPGGAPWLIFPTPCIWSVSGLPWSSASPISSQ